MSRALPIGSQFPRVDISDWDWLALEYAGEVPASAAGQEGAGNGEPRECEGRAPEASARAGIRTESR